MICKALDSSSLQSQMVLMKVVCTAGKCITNLELVECVLGAVYPHSVKKNSGDVQYVVISQASIYPTRYVFGIRRKQVLSPKINKLKKMTGTRGKSFL